MFRGRFDSALFTSSDEVSHLTGVQGSIHYLIIFFNPLTSKVLTEANHARFTLTLLGIQKLLNSMVFLILAFGVSIPIAWIRFTSSLVGRLRQQRGNVARDRGFHICEAIVSFKASPCQDGVFNVRLFTFHIQARLGVSANCRHG